MGLNGLSIEQELEMDIKKISNFQTINEIREKYEMKPIEGEAGELILNPTYSQAIQQAKMAEQQQQMGMGGGMPDDRYTDDGSEGFNWDDYVDTGDDEVQEAISNDIEKAFDESKHKRNHGKFSTTNSTNSVIEKKQNIENHGQRIKSGIMGRHEGLGTRKNRPSSQKNSSTQQRDSGQGTGNQRSSGTGSDGTGTVSVVLRVGRTGISWQSIRDSQTTKRLLGKSGKSATETFKKLIVEKGLLSPPETREKWGKQMSKGEEARVYEDPNNEDLVIKELYPEVSSLSTWEKMEELEVYNKYFPETNYDLIGFIEPDPNDKNYKDGHRDGLNLILHQKLVHGDTIFSYADKESDGDEKKFKRLVKSEYKKAASYFEKKGFTIEKSELSVGFYLEKDGYEFADLHIENVMRDDKDRYFIIDTDIIIPEKLRQKHNQEQTDKDGSSESFKKAFDDFMNQLSNNDE